MADAKIIDGKVIAADLRAETAVKVEDFKNKFNKKVVTYIRNFEKFYKAEEYHQDFYKIKLERYLRYKKACGREELLKRIWSQ